MASRLASASTVCPASLICHLMPAGRAPEDDRHAGVIDHDGNWLAAFLTDQPSGFGAWRHGTIVP